MIGRFYVAIDKNLKDRGSRADNVYRFIERVVECSQSSDATMSYGLDKEIVEVKALRKKVKHCTETLDKFSKETDELRKQKTLKSNYALHDVLYGMSRMKSWYF